MDDKSIFDRINELVAEEHTLRAAAQTGRISSERERAYLSHLEESLDQCWDLLRRRRAARDNEQDPNLVNERPVDEVEHYLQ